MTEMTKNLARSIIDASGGDPKRTDEAASIIEAYLASSPTVGEEELARAIFEGVKKWSIEKDQDIKAPDWDDTAPEAESGREFFRAAARSALSAILSRTSAQSDNRIRELEAEVKQWRDAAHLSACEARSGQLEEMTERAEKAESSLAEARKVIAQAPLHKDFSDSALKNDLPDDLSITITVPLGFVRAARDGLSRTEASK